jgi:hypothetical protein
MAQTTTMFCSVSDVHTELVQNAGYNGDDTLIQQQILKATALIRNYTRRDWEKAVYTEFFTTYDVDITINQGRNFARFPLKEKPVSVEAGEEAVIVFNTAGRFEDTQPLQYDIDYSVDTGSNSIIMYPSKMESMGRSLRVIYTAGYPINDTDATLLDVAPNICQACIVQAAFYTQRILNASGGTYAKSDKTGSKDYSLTKSGFVADALHLIKPETRILIGSNR